MLSLLKMIEIQKTIPDYFSKLVISENLIEFLNQTILGFIYGIENQNQQETLSVFNFPEISQSKNTLIFDLDETLITSRIEPSKAKLSFSTHTDNFHIGIRPYAKEMLEYLSKYYEIIIFTASQMDYAQKIIDYLDPTKKIVKLILDRTYCYQTSHGVFVKNLQSFQNLDLSSTLIIDNSSLSYCFQPNNGVPIITWLGDENDQELVILTDYLMKLLEGEGQIVKKHQELFSIKALINFYHKLNF